MILDLHADILPFLGKADSATDNERGVLLRLQSWAERVVKQAVGNSIESASYTHYLPEAERTFDIDERWVPHDTRGNRVIGVVYGGTPEAAHLVLPEKPVRSISSVYEDPSAYGGQDSNDFASDTLLTEGTHYWLDYTTSGLSKSGILRRAGAYWPRGARTVKVTYAAGYTAAELQRGGIAEHIGFAVLLTIQRYFGQRGDSVGPIESERLGDYSVKYSTAEAQERLPCQAREALSCEVDYGRFL